MEKDNHLTHLKPRTTKKRMGEKQKQKQKQKNNKIKRKKSVKKQPTRFFLIKFFYKRFLK